VHFAEQRAAPYSMRSSVTNRYTVNNNLAATNNILCAIVESEQDIHLVHLGTMGVYGYATTGLTIPEGYLNVQTQRDDGTFADIEIIYPPSPGSIYHMTKTQDALFFYFYNKNNNIRITDLHQGIVWGTNTNETNMHSELINRFDYDGDYGTVLNRFLMQAAVGHPLTVHGTGGQTRAFIHIRDTVQCIRIALENPPHKNEKVKIFNQATETHTLRDLAQKVSELSGAEIRYYRNPRKEATENKLLVENKKFLALGLNPTTLDTGLMEEVYEIAMKYKERCIKNKIICTSVWSKEQKVDRQGQETPLE
jgi:UDP-sulfoquinovose synthase